MKKSIIYSSLISCAILAGSAATIALNESNVTHANNSSELLATTSTLDAGLSNLSDQLSSKDETVYAITDAAGHVNKSFIGNNLNTSTTPLPVELNITYALDDTEISATDLIGKSGHVKVRYDFTATKTYQDKQIPFLTVTGIMLDSAKFKNLTIDNGKIISEGDNTALIGYAMPGLSTNLDTELLPSSFTIEADTTDFELNTTYTLATSELFADLDTSKLTSVDELINSVNDLSAGLDRIISGSSELTGGLDSLLAGTKKLQSGAAELSTGASNLASGAAELSSGLGQLVDFNNSVLNKIDSTTAEVTAIAEEIIAKYDLDPALVAELTAPLTEYYNQAYSAVTTYTGNVEALSGGADALSIGATKLASGATELKSGIDTLVSGTTTLATGSHTLHDGLLTFKTSGIDRLVNFANHDLDTFLRNLRSTVSAAKSYHSYSSPTATSVKFIFKTPSLK